MQPEAIDTFVEEYVADMKNPPRAGSILLMLDGRIVLRNLSEMAHSTM